MSCKCYHLAKSSNLSVTLPEATVPRHYADAPHYRHFTVASPTAPSH